MPKNYWFKCQACGEVQKRYRNSRRCGRHGEGCAGRLERIELTVCQRIMMCAEEDSGIYLSPYDVAGLALDHAIFQRAFYDDERMGIYVYPEE